MALKFRLKGLAETFIDEICCPSCGREGNDDEFFETDHTKVTFDGIIVVVQCRSCREIFVPTTQRLGVVSPQKLRAAVERDHRETGEALLQDIEAVRKNAERLNAIRRGEVH